jgi:hypothetical protein
LDFLYGEWGVIILIIRNMWITLTNIVLYVLSLFKPYIAPKQPHA